LLLQGCAPAYYSPREPRLPPPVVEQGTQPPVTQPAQVPPASVITPEPLPAQRPQSPAVVALLDTAERQANSGDLESAAASLERAIGIDGRNPVLWYHLATVRLAQGNAKEAEQLARKSTSLAPGNSVQQARNWELIARARQAQDDIRGAAAAEQRARDLAGR
jgi:predicted Zn-dependent protease